MQFSAYYPREAAPNVWHPLRAYVFAPRRRCRQHGRRQRTRRAAAVLPEVRTALGKVTAGALITATPQLPGFQFNPPSAQIAFYEDWQHFDFKLRAMRRTDQASNGRITFTVEGVIVADIPISIYVGAKQQRADHARR